MRGPRQLCPSLGACAAHFLGSAAIGTHNFVSGESGVSGVALGHKWIHLAPEVVFTSLWGTSVVFSDASSPPTRTITAIGVNCEMHVVGNPIF
jgi:hypothetical protein